MLISGETSRECHEHDARLTNSCVVVGSSNDAGELCPESLPGEESREDALGGEISSGLALFADPSGTSA